MIKLLATGVVYRNPKPNRRSIHAWHPTLVVLDQHELLCAFDLGDAVESIDYRTYLSWSSDSGQSWSPPVRIFPDENDRLQRHTVRLSRMCDGALIGVGSRRYIEHEDEDVFNRETLGLLPNDLILLRSSDNGQTWDGPTVFEHPLEGPFEICNSVIDLGEGRWLWPTSILRRWDGTAPHGVKSVALGSRDKGRSWTDHLDVLDSHIRGVIHFESSMIQLSDGRLLAVSWAFDPKSGKSLELPYSLSDDGMTFGAARTTGLNGETSKLLSLQDDRVLCVYRRFDKPGLWANVARIDGEDWVNLEETRLWHRAESRMFGDRSAADELSSLQFGFPQPHLLPDRNVMVVFWCREDCIHNIRWLRIAVE